MLPIDAFSEGAEEEAFVEVVAEASEEDLLEIDAKKASNPSLLKATEASVVREDNQVVAAVEEVAEAVDLMDIADSSDETGLRETVSLVDPEVKGERMAKKSTANRISANKTTIVRDVVVEEDQGGSISAFSSAAHVGHVLTLKAVSQESMGRPLVLKERITSLGTRTEMEVNDAITVSVGLVSDRVVVSPADPEAVPVAHLVAENQRLKTPVPEVTNNNRSRPEAKM